MTPMKRLNHLPYGMSNWEDDDDDRPEQLPVRRTCSLSAATLRDLRTLKKKGRHGTTVSGIMTNFIEAGVRQAFREGFIENQ